MSILRKRKPKTAAGPEQVRADFDRIARLTESLSHGAPPADPTTEHLLRSVPSPCRAALEIGCGTGEFARRLATRCGSVLALDLSPEMIRVARSRSAGFPHIEYRVEDVSGWEPPREAFDCVASIATLHHLPPEETVRKMKAALRPGGVLLLNDVLTRPGVRNVPMNGVAFLARAVGRITHRHPHPTRALRQAWSDHGRGERYFRLADVRALCAAELPGARIRTHLFWRFSVVWRKPGERSAG